MINRIRRGFLWNKVLSLEHKKEYENALEVLGQMSAIESLRHYERALQAALLLRKGEYEKAEKNLREIVRDLRAAKGSDGIYTRLYCEFTLATIDGDLDRKRAARREALACPGSAGLKQWLPL